MNKLMKLLAYCSFLLLVVAPIQAQDMTELKVVNGTQENEQFQIVVAIASATGEAPMIAKIVSLASFGDFDLFSIPRTEEIMIAALPVGVDIAELTAIPAEYMEQFMPISLESAKSCDVIVKGNLTDGLNFTLANIEW